MFYIKYLAISLVLLALASADFPIEFDEPLVREATDSSIYRLPESLDPIHFEVEITPYFEATEINEAFTFDGVVSILVEARENVSVLTIHENVREIETIEVTTEAGLPVRVNAMNPFRRVREYHFLEINLAEGVTLEIGQRYIITIGYIGNINETPLSRGIFRGSYKGSDGRIHWYAASHLQPTNSRQAFPCFDEPGFKSTFDIVINRPLNFTKTYSNMQIAREELKGDRVREIFYTTPRMSAYLVTIHISEEFSVIADNNDNERSYRILARPNTEGQGAYALEVGPPITRWLEDYFGIEYYTMADGMKNDQIAVPDWASGATENWGLVSYRELRLLYEEGETNVLDKLSIGTITAHELAHKWFGNLITCRWWDNVWINEGFASYFEYFAMDGVDRTMELEDQFNIMYLQSALSADSSASTRALQHTVNSPAEVTAHFSGITYSKGASLLLMLKHFVTEDTFKKALSRFLTTKSFEHTYPEDLYVAFEEVVAETSALDGISGNINIYDFMQYWVDKPGYPVINVDVDMSSGEISITQERFFISASASQTEQQLWPIPLTYTTGNNPNWDDLRPRHVMTSQSYELNKGEGHEWVIFNVQQKGIYRVNYDTHNWEMIASALKTNSETESIHHLNKAQIVDDVFALMRSERMTHSLGFKILDFLKNETSFYPWYPAITGFNWLRNRFLHLPDSLKEFDEVLFSFMDAVINEVGYSVKDEEPLTTTLNRFYILSFACNIEHEGCVNDAIERFHAFRTTGTNINPNIRRHVLCTGLRQGSYQDWSFVRDLYLSSNNQAAKVAYLRALGCTTNRRATNEYLQMVLGDDVKAQDSLNALTFLYMGDRSNARLALPFIADYIDEIRRKVVLATWFTSVLSNLAGYLDEEGLEQMEEWLEASQSSIPEYNVGLSAINSARASMQWGTERAQAILEAARGSAIVVLPTSMLLITTLIAMLLK